jgi:hypothetical protein
MTGNELVSFTKRDKVRSFLVAKGTLGERRSGPRPARRVDAAVPSVDVKPLARFPEPAPAPAIRPLSVMGIGSWPRPRWMLQAVHEHMEGRLDEEAFQSTADDAVRLAIGAQLRAGADVITDGEQRRDSYSSFVASRRNFASLDRFALVTTSFGARRALDVAGDGAIRRVRAAGCAGESRSMKWSSHGPDRRPGQGGSGPIFDANNVDGGISVGPMPTADLARDVVRCCVGRLFAGCAALCSRYFRK